MTEITRFDISATVIMSLAIIIMTFVFPALGLADPDTNAGEIPEFNVSTDRFDFAGEMPRAPGTPTNIHMTWDGTRPAEFSDNQVWLNGGTTGGTELLLLPASPFNNSVEVRLNAWNSSGVVTDSVAQNFNSTGESGFMRLNDYLVTWSVESYTAVDNTTAQATVDVEVKEQPVSGGGWIGRIPVVGAAFEATQATAATLAWFASIVLWGLTSFVEILTNASGAVFDLVVFFVDLFVWLGTVYTAIIDGSSSWSTIFVTLPGILLSLLFAKFVSALAEMAAA